jgi:NADH:ubiquinone oxidoreductase subunit F (NADH-binding)
LSGHVQRVAILEVPFGLPLRRLIDACGGLPEGRTLKAIQPGGPLGGIINTEHVDISLEPEPFREQGALLGSGGLIIFDDTACIIDMCMYFERFADARSRCTPATAAPTHGEILRRTLTAARRHRTGHAALLGDTRRSNCAHGTAAPR